MKLPVEKCKGLRHEEKEKKKEKRKNEEVIGFSKRIETLPAQLYLGHFFSSKLFSSVLAFCQ